MLKTKTNQIEVISQKLYWISSKIIPTNELNSIIFSTDKELTYKPINKDFGPLSIEKIIPFINELEKLLEINQFNNKIIYYYTGLQKMYRCNSAFLIGCFMIVKMKISSLEILKIFSKIEPKLENFTDSYHGSKIYDLPLHNFFRAVEFSVKLKIFKPLEFNKKNYIFFNNMKNGYMNWIVEKKLLIFSSPNDLPKKFESIENIKSENFIPFLKKIK